MCFKWIVPAGATGRLNRRQETKNLAFSYSLRYTYVMKLPGKFAYLLVEQT